MRELALFAGAGGGILGGHLLGWRTVCAVEIDSYCATVLAQRQTDGLLPPFPIWSDVRTFDGTAWRGIVDVVSAGFPCQPYSIAGKQLGAADERDMWPDTIRIIGEVRPGSALLENVPNLIASGYLWTVLADLAALGFDAEWGVVGAHHTGAPHKRDRVWIVATNPDAKLGEPRTRAEQQHEELTHVAGVNGCNPRDHISSWVARARQFRGVDDGIPCAVERTAALGNAQVPQAAALAWRLLA